MLKNEQITKRIKLQGTLKSIPMYVDNSWLAVDFCTLYKIMDIYKKDIQCELYPHKVSYPSHSNQHVKDTIYTFCHNQWGIRAVNHLSFDEVNGKKPKFCKFVYGYKTEACNNFVGYFDDDNKARMIFNCMVKLYSKSHNK